MGVGAASGQTRRPAQQPPVRLFEICAMRMELLLRRALDGAVADSGHPAASGLAESLYQFERDRLTSQVEDELGPLAFAHFVPRSPSEGETRLEGLLALSCMHQALERGLDSAGHDVQAHSRRIWDHFYAPVELGPVANHTLRLELPPSDLIVPGDPFSGRVVDDRLREGWPESRRAVEDGLVVEAAGQTVGVGRDGLFVLRAPEVPATYAVEVRHREKASPLPIDDAFTVVALDAAGEAQRGEPPSAPRLLLPQQPLVVLGRLRGGGAGLATRAFVGPWEVPLLAKTPIAAIFDVTRVPAGRHPLTVFEGGELIAAAAVDRVTLSVSSDRSSLDRGETATFTVRVDGLPMASPPPSSAPGGAGSAAIAFLDYVNNTPEAGRFRGRPDRFSVPIAASDLTPAPPPARGWDQRELIELIETLVTDAANRAELAVAGEPLVDDATGESGQPAGLATAPVSASGTLEQTQDYRAGRVGDFHVRVALRLREESTGRASMIVPRSAGALASAGQLPPPQPGMGQLTGDDEHGEFVDIEGQRFYFSIGYPRMIGYARAAAAVPPPIEAGRLFEASCTGSCQCQIQSWDHGEEVGDQVKALDRSDPAWRDLTATARGCARDETRSRCYSLLSIECKARCKRHFESSLTERVSGFAGGAELPDGRDVGACER